MSMVAWGAFALGLCGVLTGKPTTNFVSHGEPVIQAEEFITPTETVVEGDACSCGSATECSCNACLEGRPGLFTRIAGKLHSLKYSLHTSSCGCATGCGSDVCGTPRFGIFSYIKGAFHHPTDCSYACDDICGLRDGDIIEGEIADAIPSEVTVDSKSAPCPSCGHYIAPSNKPVVIQPAPELPPAKPAVKVATPTNKAIAPPAKTSPVIGRKREELTPVPVQPQSTIKQMSALLPMEATSSNHAQNVTWVQGELWFAHVREGNGMWMLRHLPADQSSINEGSVALVADGRLEQFRDGDIVRVSGEVVRNSSEASLGTATFRIRTIMLVAPGANR